MAKKTTVLSLQTQVVAAAPGDQWAWDVATGSSVPVGSWKTSGWTFGSVGAFKRGMKAHPLIGNPTVRLVDAEGNVVWPE